MGTLRFFARPDDAGGYNSSSFAMRFCQRPMGETNMDERIRSDNELGLGDAGPYQPEPTRISLDPLHGVVQGLASIAIGMTFIVGAPATMLVIWVLFDGHFRGFNRLDIVLVAICGFLGCLMILASAVFGLIFGITAILAARQHNRPASLGIAGVLLTGFCIFLWIFIAVLWAFAIGARI